MYIYGRRDNTCYVCRGWGWTYRPLGGEGAAEAAVLVLSGDRDVAMAALSHLRNSQTNTRRQQRGRGGHTHVQRAHNAWQIRMLHVLGRGLECAWKLSSIGVADGGKKKNTKKPAQVEHSEGHHGNQSDGNPIHTLQDQYSLPPNTHPHTQAPNTLHILC